MDNLPHLVLDEPAKPNKKKFLAVVVISLMVVLLPVALLLVRQQTQTRSQAALNLRNPETSLSIKVNNNLGGLVEADVYIKSDIEAANLADVKMGFDKTALEVVSIATSSAALEKKSKPFASKWLESSFDNSLGKISLIAGTPNPGVKTDPTTGTEAILATIIFRPKITTSSSINFDPTSMLYSEEGNVNILKKAEEVAVELNSTPVVASSSPSINTNPKLNLQITTPVLGNSYYYFNPLDITWSGEEIENILGINLYLNGSLFGPLTQNIVNTGKFSWKPDQTVLIPYLQSDNNFQIGIIAQDKQGNQVTGMSGKFGLTTEQDQVTSGQTFMLNTDLTVRDASKILSNYNVNQLTEPALDLNRDGVINDLDLFLLRESLFRRDLILIM
jgi:hypothetical protein